MNLDKMQEILKEFYHNLAKKRGRPTKVAVLDSETTGLNPERNDIVQLALIIKVDGKEEGRYNLKMQPFNYKDISIQALKLQGRTLEDIKKFPDPKEMFSKLVKLFDIYIDKFDKQDKFFTVGYNLRFDLDFLNSYWDKNKNKYLGSYINWRGLDLLYLIYMKNFLGEIPDLDNYKLGTVAEHYGYGFKAHDAMNDADIVDKLADRFIATYGASILGVA